MVTHYRWARGLGTAQAVIALAAIMVVSACKGIMDVQLPGNVEASALATPTLAGLLVNSAQADFECAYALYVYNTSAWSNEMQNASGGAEVASWSGRFFIPEGGTGGCQTVASNRGAFVQYLPLMTARQQAENALTVIGGFTDADVSGRQLLLARAALYSGFVHTLLGEAYCSVALTDTGAVQPPVNALLAAEDRFTKAIAFATTAKDAMVLNSALVGRARVRLDLGKLAGAAADAKLVPANFVGYATYDVNPIRRQNSAYDVTALKHHLSVDPAYRNLTVGGVPDSRLVVTNAGYQGADGVTPMWLSSKYTSLSSPIPIASWDEAQLIIAEAEGGQSAVDAINGIRAKYNLPSYSGGTDAEIQAQVIEERRRTLFFTGHRIGDQLRLKIPFAQGVDQKGVPYNNDASCVGLPLNETTGR